MGVYLFVSTLIIAMLTLATWCNIQIAPDHPTLPMQWSLKGQVNWRAPRLVALFSTPLVVTLALALIILLPSERGEGEQALIFIALLGPIIQLRHIWLIRRSLGEDGETRG